MNNSVTCSFLITTALIALAVITPPSSVEGIKCVAILSDSTDEKVVKVRQDCLQTNMPDYSKAGSAMGLNSTLESFDFDDNCYQHCVYKGCGVSTAEESVKKDSVSVLQDIKDAPANLTEALLGAWNKCIEDTETIGKAKNLTPCKMSSLHSFCFSKQIYEGKLLIRNC